MATPDDTLGKRIAAKREHRGILQKELAERAGLSVSFLSDVENDKRSPGSDALLRIADVLGSSLDYLMRGETRLPEREPLIIPPALADAAEARKWSYARTAALLEAQLAALARRSAHSLPERAVSERSVDDWIKLYKSLFPDE